MGNIWYDVGQVIQIASNEDSSSQSQMYDGDWLIIGVNHTFKNKNFTTVLTCSRTYYKMYNKNLIQGE